MWSRIPTLIRKELQALLRDPQMLAIIRDRAVTHVASPALKPTDIRIEAAPEPRGLSIMVRNNDRSVAQKGNQATISVLVDHFAFLRTTEGRTSNGYIHGPWVEVIDPPTLPVWPSPPGFLLTLPQWLVLGGALGAAGLTRVRWVKAVTLP
jgi:hypothetical protein